MTDQSQPEATVRRVMPQSGLDMNMMLTDTMYGSKQIGEQLKRKMKDRLDHPDDIDRTEAWELLSFYTRDLRLSNIGEREMIYCSYYIDLAGDLLREGYLESFSKALALAATVLELSQSKGGFLRKRTNTITSENMSGEINPEKKRLLFSGSKKQGGG